MAQSMEYILAPRQKYLQRTSAAIAALGLLFSIQSHAMANSSRAFEIPKNGFRSREDLMREFSELSERRCANGLFSSGIAGRQCMLILNGRLKKCREEILVLMPEKIMERADAIMWAKRHAHCLDM